MIYMAALAGLAVYAIHRTVLTTIYWKTRRTIDNKTANKTAAATLDKEQPKTDGESSEIPQVTVQLPIYNERNVVTRLLESAAQLRWPTDRLQIQVLDDSTDSTRELCARECQRWRSRGIDIVHIHRTHRMGYKAGALAAGTAMARGDFILILDADFVAPPDLIERMLESFDSPTIGMVQVRWEHLNRNESMLTQVQALLLDGHFGVEQSARARSGRFFNFNGTAGMWRRAAIADAGGWQHDTLTEDLDLSYRALLAGWQFRYLPTVSAPAELPSAMRGFKSQQFRWAKGSIQVARKLLWRVLTAPLPIRFRIEGFFHLTQNVPYLLTVILAISAVPALALHQRPSGLGFAVLDLGLLIGTVGTLTIYCASAEFALGKSWLAALTRLPALIAVTSGISLNQTRAVLEGVLGIQSGFVRTPKEGAHVPRFQQRYRSRVDLLWLAELALAGYFVVGGGVAVFQHRWAAVPALAIFAFGFGYVGIRSLLGR